MAGRRVTSHAATEAISRMFLVFQEKVVGLPPRVIGGVGMLA
jgi:hypothetical protein